MKLAHLHLPSITPFSKVSHIQELLTARLLSEKKKTPPHTPPAPTGDQTIITFTPNPVYTTGRRDLPPSLKHPTTTTELSAALPRSLEPVRSILVGASSSSSSRSNDGHIKAEYHPTLRGGQTTYHGPGQMVAYTILDLRRLGLSPRGHIRLLEDSVIDVLHGFGIRGFTTEDPGVWVSSSSGPKKITAVGVHLRRNISSYGIGFNVTEEPMWYFRQIVPCGLEGKEATSLQAIMHAQQQHVGVDEVAWRFVGAFVNRLNSGAGQKIQVYPVKRVDDIL